MIETRDLVIHVQDIKSFVDRVLMSCRCVWDAVHTEVRPLPASSHFPFPVLALGGRRRFEGDH